jgi:hypothetical protein
VEKTKSRRILQIGDYKTLPLIMQTARTVTPIPSLGSGQAKFEYRDPTFASPPYHYSHEWLVRVAENVTDAEKVVRSWSDHFSSLAYFLQFQDDQDAEKFKQFHSHTELATAIIEGRLDISCEPLWETYEWLVDFKFVQEAYRKDNDREVNYEQHVAALERLSELHLNLLKSIRVVQRALDKIKAHSSEWQALPGITTSKSIRKSSNVSLFYSYSHCDELLRDELEKHLAALHRQGHIEQWHDRRIGPGDDWRGQIERHLEEADIILLLISSDFIASDYCYDVEMELALKRHKAKQATVIPVFLRPCDWAGCSFGSIQGLPKDAKPVTSWPDRDSAFTDISKGIRNAVEHVAKSRLAP